MTSRDTMKHSSSDELVARASAWWSTAIIDIEPGQIGIRGYPIQDLVGELRFPQMIWLMLRGEIPSRPLADLLEAALVAAVDHGPHAPSIAIARMAVSCGLPLNGAMASAINALDDVHGGAGQQCMELYVDIAREAGDAEARLQHVEIVLDRFVAANGKIVPGYGHRFHPVDPRAVKLLALVDAAEAAGVVSGRWSRIGKLVEKALCARTGKLVPMNIDGATAVIFSELGFAPPLGRGLFILSRAVGILAHAWEQSNEGARIKGPMPPAIPYRYTGVALRRLESGNASPLSSSVKPGDLVSGLDE